jgi:hypothetical protein
VGFLAALTITALNIQIHFPLLRFFDPIALFTVTGFSLAFLLQAHGFEGCRKIKAAFVSWFGGRALPSGDVGRTVHVVQSLPLATMRGAHLAVMISFLSLARMYTWGEDLTGLGVVVFQVLVPYLYAICFNQFLWEPMARWMLHRTEEIGGSAHPIPEATAQPGSNSK